ncbi:Na+/H+ antiporter NhaD/arsenite permease-like protein [Actinophytocola algeriensis]|uniref:Na+/H+ antiporter NhaD/arsenite permease-like protein n=1 Tax=Actinophytocola algeriensis TaxID=1768010 RepID=A0A7W7QDF5_9PSEU|nr:Na+/H+ antiporter NhaD/arsenite permease-like protein [Actinophytocola algeriensis]MBE1473412.1 Na+/H+ antiporter NhaD/arsenite permease-like protein [Actinophytocola algeriensis]
MAADATGGDALVAVMLILIVSAFLSGIIDNIPYVATMSPIVLELANDSASPCGRAPRSRSGSSPGRAR